MGVPNISIPAGIQSFVTNTGTFIQNNMVQPIHQNVLQPAQGMVKGMTSTIGLPQKPKLMSPNLNGIVSDPYEKFDVFQQVNQKDREQRAAEEKATDTPGVPQHLLFTLPQENNPDSNS